ncbi:MAG TPA: hypothetical protein VGJ20_45785 [Xanthobacteraceae bacterium]
MLSYETVRFSSDRFPVPLPCPNCGRTMQLTRATAHTGGISELRSYGCGECGLWTSEDAMSRRGWSSEGV